MTPLRGGVALTLDPFTGREGGESLDCALITASFVVPYDRLILLLWSLASGTSKIRPRFVYSVQCRDSLGLKYQMRNENQRAGPGRNHQRRGLFRQRLNPFAFPHNRPTAKPTIGFQVEKMNFCQHLAYELYVPLTQLPHIFYQINFSEFIKRSR
ncbi:hypothetical protein CDAR_304451 [Caerostris darwini]|uniref:Uncharacterized protein n=1 Tax=Caerostris darwini TaxID=1538125 RepID=A0AAV4NLV3_9ARAC|nr:hypothetical protein CDAR_304451 [Caerostris darwini]